MILKANLLFTLTLTFSSLLSQKNDLVNVRNFGKNAGMLKMFWHIPVNLDNTKKVPLVIVLHGCTQSAKSIANATDWNKLADSLHFIVVYPEQRMLNNISKCFNFFIGFKAKKDKGEVSSIRQMINYTFEHHSIDGSKVFITGMSAGGGMSNAMLNAYPELFNSGALLAAPSIIMGKLNTSPDHVPKIAIIQGEKDKVVPKKQATNILNQWISKNNLDSSKFKTIENFQNNKYLSAQTYTNKNNELKIILLKIKSTGHKILINPGNDIKHGGTSGIHTKDIDFHSTYWIADFFGLTKNNSLPLR